MKLVCILLLALVIPAAMASTQSVGSVTIDPSPIDLTAGSTTMVTCTAMIEDDESWENINLVNATLWDSATSSEYSFDDNSDHYSTRDCISIENSTEPPYSVYTCSFSMQYYSNPSVWACKIRSYNAALEEASNQETATVNSLTALELSSPTLDFGTISIGHSSDDDVSINVTNMGNVEIDVNVSGTDFSCTTGSFWAEYARFSASPEEVYESMTPLSLTPTTLAIGISQSDDSMITPLPIFWKISIPSSEARGTCNSTISLVAEQKQV